MPFRLGKWAVVLLLVIVTGGHWAFLQSVAWVGMTIRFAQTDSLLVALEKSLDGAHPCKLCKVVEQGKKSEKQQEAKKIETKFDWISAQKQASVLPIISEIEYSSWVEAMTSRLEAPPVPPPRAA